MIKIKSITMKNFLSVGAVTQSIALEGSNLTLVLGTNLDQGGSGNRNGTGKSLIIQAICFALYGSPLTNIKKDNLINKTNGKGMVVSIEFEKDGKRYRIERGRKPGFFRFYINNNAFAADDDKGTDEAHGESRITQQEIDKVLCMSRDLFKHIVALNTFAEPFLNQGAGQQRQLIEELLGITQLSYKADKLREEIKNTKDGILAEEYSIKSIQDANAKIQGNIDQIKKKSTLWQSAKDNNIANFKSTIDELEKIDVEQEIEAHKVLGTFAELDAVISQLDKDKANRDRAIANSMKQVAAFERQGADAETRLADLIHQLTHVQNKTCPMCKQDLSHTGAVEDLAGNLEGQILTCSDGIATAKTHLEEAKAHLKADQDELAEVEGQLKVAMDTLKDMGKRPYVHYKTVEEAYNHRASLANLKEKLETEIATENPFDEQIQHLEENAIQVITYDKLNQLSKLKDHQEFLLKLLTDKSSFIRKKIIDQNLSFLNFRLNHYLDKVGLPHEVRFLNDLTTEITELGREFDFDNLSRGEKTRLILGLSFSFRDIWENLNSPLNLLFIDELLDNGLDPSGIESSVAILKNLGRDRGKDVFLISHREELLSRVTKVMVVKKEGGFTTFTDDAELVNEV